MSTLTTRSKTIVRALAAMLLFATVAAAQFEIGGLCNTGQIGATAAGCTGVLVPPNPVGGGPAHDGNWQLAVPYPSTLPTVHSPCLLKGFVRAWVDTPNAAWLPDGVSAASEWITPFNGENNLPAGWYVYRTAFPIPAVLPGGAVPTGVRINGHLASDNPTAAIYLESPAGSANCSRVTGQQFPVNPAGVGDSDFEQWWDFSFTNSLPVAPGTFALLYFVVENTPLTGNPTPTGLRVEFFPSSVFN